MKDVHDKVICKSCGYDITGIDNRWGIWHGVGLCVLILTMGKSNEQH